MKCFTNSAKYRTNDALPPCISPEEDLPVKPQKEWVHMDKLEPEKLEWIDQGPACPQTERNQAGTNYCLHGTLCQEMRGACVFVSPSDYHCVSALTGHAGSL